MLSGGVIAFDCVSVLIIIVRQLPSTLLVYIAVVYCQSCKVLVQGKVGSQEILMLVII